MIAGFRLTRVMRAAAFQSPARLVHIPSVWSRWTPGITPASASRGSFRLVVLITLAAGRFSLGSRIPLLGPAGERQSRSDRGWNGAKLAFRRSGVQASRIGRDSSAFDLAGPERPNA